MYDKGREKMAVDLKAECRIENSGASEASRNLLEEVLSLGLSSQGWPHLYSSSQLNASLSNSGPAAYQPCCCHHKHCRARTGRYVREGPQPTPFPHPSTPSQGLQMQCDLSLVSVYIIHLFHVHLMPAFPSTLLWELKMEILLIKGWVKISCFHKL